MKIGLIPQGEPGIFRQLLLPEVADAMVAGEPITALAVTIDDIAVGAVAGCIEGNRFQIMSFYVAPDYRRRGIGTLLIETLIDISKKSVYGLEINFTTTEEEHKILHPFLETLKFKKEEDNGNVIYLATVGELLNNIERLNLKNQIGVPFSELDTHFLISATKEMQKKYEQIPEDGFESKTVDRDVSIAIIKDETMSTYVAVEQILENSLMLSAVRADSRNPGQLISVLFSSLMRIKEKYPLDTKYIIPIVRSDGEAVLHALLPENVEQISFTYYRSLYEAE